jgi:hypothetical protein
MAENICYSGILVIIIIIEVKIERKSKTWLLLIDSSPCILMIELKGMPLNTDFYVVVGKKYRTENA